MTFGSYETIARKHKSYCRRFPTSAHWASWRTRMIQERQPVVAELHSLQSPFVWGQSMRQCIKVGRCGLHCTRMECVARWVAPRAKRTRTSRAGCKEGKMATRGCQLRGTSLSRNVYLSSPQPNATGHVKIAKRPRTPSSRLTRLELLLFRVFLQRRLSLPLFLTKRICRCGRLVVAFGLHCAVCSR